MSDIVLISTVTTRAIFDAARNLSRRCDEEFDFKVFYPPEIDEEIISEEHFQRELLEARIVFIDIRSGGRVAKIVHRTLKDGKNTVFTLIGTSELFALTRVGSFSMKRFFAERKGVRGDRSNDVQTEVDKPRMLMERIEKISNIIEKGGKLLPVGVLKHARNYVLATRYWQYGGEENIENMLLMALREYGGRKHLSRPQSPVEVPEYGLAHPAHGVFTKLDEYLAASGYDDGRSTLGVLFFGGMHQEQAMPVLRWLSAQIGNEFNLIPVFSDSLHNLEGMSDFFFREGKPLVDAVISLRWFRLNGGPLGGDPAATQELLKKLNVPVFNPIPMLMREIQKWEEQPRGLSPIELICGVVWPELDGCIEPIPSCGVVDNLGIKDVNVIEDRMERVVGRIRKWLALRAKSNMDKRIAIILYDYPPGEGNIGGAAYLDTFKSVQILLRKLKKEGYRIDEPVGKFSELFHKRGIINSAQWTSADVTLEHCPSLAVKDYEIIFKNLPENAQKDLLTDWGPPPGEVMTAWDKLLIPGIELGNVFVCLQPSRGIHENPEKAYHDKTIPPHHQYVAFYRWLEEVWKADAIIHVGTHGTVEFTKGKEVGMSSKCFPDILIGNLPHLYIYHVVNTSESTIAKRRTYATMVSYNSPPYTASGLYEQYVVLEDLVHEYNEALVLDRLRAARVANQIRAKAEDLNLDASDVDDVMEQLYEIKRSIIPKGLHELGRRYEAEELLDFAHLLLRYDRSQCRSLNRLVAESCGIDYDFALRHPGDRVGNKSCAQILEEVDEVSRQIVETAFESIEGAIELAALPVEYREELERTLQFGIEVAVKYGNNDLEIENLIRGLEVRFIRPNLGGDVIRDPEVLPTGGNIYQFDPNLIPSAAACERGAEVAENTLRHYLDKQGKYPESIGIVLWGFETTKTRGETIGQIFHYLGVRVERRGGTWNPSITIVPQEELGRPRIDCLVNICGFFRDMFPNVIGLLNRAFEMVATLDEDPAVNYVKKHSDDALAELTEIEDEKLVHRLSTSRLFGPPAGEYGTKVISLIETSNWQDENDLAERHIQSMNHVYAENVHAKRLDGLYRKLLSNVDVVSQVRDSNDYEIVDLDHYYEFFGGLTKSVEMVKGEKPEMLISDTTREVLKTEDVHLAINRGVRTRLLNPIWIDGMLAHEFHGAQKIADRVEYMLGLASTTHAVKNWIWDGFSEQYIFDEAMLERLRENNRWALVNIMKTLFEARNRGYWEATEEQIEKLRKAYMEAEGWIEETVSKGDIIP